MDSESSEPFMHVNLNNKANSFDFSSSVLLVQPIDKSDINENLDFSMACTDLSEVPIVAIIDVMAIVESTKRYMRRGRRRCLIFTKHLPKKLERKTRGYTEMSVAFDE